jgi:hypothetical protein
MSNSELFLNMKVNTTEYEISHNPTIGIFITNTLHNNEETKVLTNTDLTTNDGWMSERNCF